jgi:hypothetical protein
MAYGTNAPFGLRPMNSLAGGSWTEKVNEYKIYASADGTSTYAVSLFTGDPVQWGTSVVNTPTTTGLVGTIALYAPTFADATPSTFSTVPILGIFMGCRYQAANSVSSTPYIASPYWPASAQVKPGTSIIAYVLDDPNVIFDIQVSSHINAAANVFVGNPIFPNSNVTGAASPFQYAGTFGRNFALNVGGGTNFNTVPTPADPGDGSITYANNPTGGSTLSGQSAFYLDVDTSTVAGYNNHDYAKNVTTLPLKAIAYTLKPENVSDPALTMATTPFLNVTVVINNHVYGKGSTPPVYVA